MMRPRKNHHSRWPLFAIGASAGAAVWSGWVGLGELVGFGVVHPLPGIADDFTINTAITLPIGVEAYAMYALSVATSGRDLPDRTRRYAWTSAVVSLVLGMGGQVAYHLMEASGMTSAPWQIVAAVSCLPVAVLGAASVLWHLASGADQDDDGQADERQVDDAPASELPAAADMADPVVEQQLVHVEHVPTPQPEPVHVEPEPLPEPVQSKPRPVDAPSKRRGSSDEEILAVIREVLASNPAAGRPAVMTALDEADVSCGTSRAGDLLRQEKAGGHPTLRAVV